MDNMQVEKMLELMKLSSEDWEAFTIEYESLTLAERADFKDYLVKVQGHHKE